MNLCDMHFITEFMTELFLHRDESEPHRVKQAKTRANANMVFQEDAIYYYKVIILA